MKNHDATPDNAAAMRADPSLAHGRALLDRSRLLGRISAVIFLLAAFSVIDGLQTLMRLEFNSIDIIPGEQVILSGMLPYKVEQHTDLEVTIEGADGLSFLPRDTYKGFWMGGKMWRADLVAAPDARPGTAVLTVVDLMPVKKAPAPEKEAAAQNSTAHNSGAQSAASPAEDIEFGPQNPTLVYTVTIWPDFASRRAADLSFLRAHTGVAPFVVAAITTFFALLAGAGNWLVFSRAETSLAGNGVFFIHGIKVLNSDPKVPKTAPDGIKVSFAHAGKDDFTPGDEVFLYDRAWQKQGRGKIMEKDKVKGFALFSKTGVAPRYGWLIFQSDREAN